MNVISIAGRLGMDPELKFSQGGTSILRMRIAISERKRQGGEWKDSTLWLTAITFGNRAEALNKILSKGAPVAITGRLEVREYERKDGGKGTAVEVIASDVTLMGGKGERSERYASTPTYEPPEGGDFGDDDIPF